MRAVKSAWLKFVSSCKRSIFGVDEAGKLSHSETLLAVSRKEGRCTPVGVLGGLIEAARTASWRVVPLNHSTFATKYTPKRGRLQFLKERIEKNF